MSQSDSDEMKTLNIILIGETGVGKSSFINLFPIYFKNDHLDNVDQNLSLLIPSLVTIYDKNGDEHELRVGSSKYEIQETGASGTQVVTPYEFICEKDNNNFRVRLIDTPGLGDPRGLQKDNEHCEMVLNYLDELDEVHAFCFLMRPTNTRNTILFDYCIQQIMTRLHKSACQNIIFVFTNTSGQHYKPGNTLPGLKRMIKDINSKLADMTINLDKINMFSLDNECLNYLVAKQNNVKLEEYSKQCYEKSWEVSKKECLRLLEYVENLKPHEVRSTTSLNKTSGLIYDMYKPLSDISNLLQENIVALEKNKKEIESSNEKVNELKEKLYMNQTELEVIKSNMYKY